MPPRLRRARYVQTPRLRLSRDPDFAPGTPSTSTPARTTFCSTASRRYSLRGGSADGSWRRRGRADGSRRRRGREYSIEIGARPQVRSQIPIFVSEWGTSSADGNGGVCTGVAERFLDVFSDKDGTGGVTLSFAQWSWADKAESSAALSEGACADGAWDDLSCSGEFLKSYIQSNVGGSPDDCVCRALAPEDTAFAPVTDEWSVRPRPTGR